MDWKDKGKHPLYNFRFTVEIEKSHKIWKANAHKILAEIVENWNNGKCFNPPYQCVLALAIFKFSNNNQNSPS